MDLSRRKRKRDAVGTVASWWHSIDLGDGVISPGRKTPAILEKEVEALRLPPLVGKTVLDIGAWDGFFSFEAERRGARRVVALDHYIWRINSERLDQYLRECDRSGHPPRPFDEVLEIWHQDECPGRQGFDIAHALLESKVEPVVADFMTMDLSELDAFDVVLYLGVLYHMRHPLLALERLRTVTGDLAIIESEMAYAPHLEDTPMCQFFERDEHRGDWSNWWCPNMAAVTAMCRAAGFRSAEAVCGPPSEYLTLPPGTAPTHYRGIVHARP